MKNKINAYSIIELMIVVSIIGVLATIAVPAYTGYVEATQQQVTEANMGTLQFFQEQYFLDQQTYLAGVYNPATNKATSPLVTQLNWRPDQDKDNFIYTVAACSAGTIATCYTVTVSGFSGQVSATLTRQP